MKVKIVRKDPICLRPNYQSQYNIGDVIEISDTYLGNNSWYKRKGSDAGFIFRRDCEVIMDRPELKSGMILEKNDGTRGIVVGRTILWFYKEDNSVTYTSLDDRSSEGSVDRQVAKIYKGSAYTHSYAVHPDGIYNDNYLAGTLIWEATKPKIVKLNSQYEAEILDNGKVKVGCQEFDLEKIEEIVKLARS